MEPTATREEEWVRKFRAGEYTADELLARYAAEVYRVTGSYEEAAHRMALDRRTVKAKVKKYLSGGMAPSDSRRVSS